MFKHGAEDANEFFARASIDLCQGEPGFIHSAFNCGGGHGIKPAPEDKIMKLREDFGARGVPTRSASAFQGRSETRSRPDHPWLPRLETNPRPASCPLPPPRVSRR